MTMKIVLLYVLTGMLLFGFNEAGKSTACPDYRVDQQTLLLNVILWLPLVIAGTGYKTATDKGLWPFACDPEEPAQKTKTLREIYT